jgi:uncharacterized membrane protein
MTIKYRNYLRNSVLLFLFSLGIWQTLRGDNAFGSGLIGASVLILIALTIKQRRVMRDEANGMNVYDERIWAIAGRAAYFTYVTFTLAGALIVLIGSVWGPVISVNPYNFLGLCLCAIVFLYVGYYYYFSYKS